MKAGRAGRLAGRVVFITGAGSGIGAAVAVECARLGADLVLFDRRAASLRTVAAHLRPLRRRVLVVHGTVDRTRDLQRALAAARRHFGHIDMAIADAGFEVTGRVDELTLADFRRQFETNVFGVLRTVYATLGDLERSRGALVLIGSMLGHVALPGTSAYAMSKFAVTALARTLRFELAPRGISVTLVSPGNVATNIRRVDNRNVLHPAARDPIPAWLQISASGAAHHIVRAALRRRPEVVLTRLAKLALLAERVSPALVAFTIRRGHVQSRREPRACRSRPPNTPAGRDAASATSRPRTAAISAASRR
jgi:NAD(P)-dependent dehydrogenase (short-subunit alcohol dehydrogenase family)